MYDRLLRLHGWQCLRRPHARRPGGLDRHLVRDFPTCAATGSILASLPLSPQALDKRRTAAERELQGGLRVLARHLPQDQWEALADGIAVRRRSPRPCSLFTLWRLTPISKFVRPFGWDAAVILQVEQRLRARIAELQEYRAMVRSASCSSQHAAIRPCCSGFQYPSQDHQVCARVQGLRTFEQVDEVEALQETRKKRGAHLSVCVACLQRGPSGSPSSGPASALADRCSRPFACLATASIRQPLDRPPSAS